MPIEIERTERFRLKYSDYVAAVLEGLRQDPTAAFKVSAGSEVESRSLFSAFRTYAHKLEKGFGVEVRRVSKTEIVVQRKVKIKT